MIACGLPSLFLWALISEIRSAPARETAPACAASWPRSEEHTSELQSQSNLVCRLLLEKKHAPNPRAHRRAPGRRCPTPAPKSGLWLATLSSFSDTALKIGRPRHAKPAQSRSARFSDGP